MEDSSAPQVSETPPRPKSVAELARHLGVHRSQVSRAIATARRDPAIPDPPGSETDDLGRHYFPLDEFLRWWPTRRPVGSSPQHTPVRFPAGNDPMISRATRRLHHGTAVRVDPGDGHGGRQVADVRPGWDNQGNGSTMAALAARGLITRSSRGTTFGTMHTVTLTRQGRAAARAGTSLTPGRKPQAALGHRAWEVLVMLWKLGLRGEVLDWDHSPTIENVLIGKHIPPLAEKVRGGYAITDRGRDFYRQQYAVHWRCAPGRASPAPGRCQG
jgi:hypothetical protein